MRARVGVYLCLAWGTLWEEMGTSWVTCSKDDSCVGSYPCDSKIKTTMVTLFEKGGGKSEGGLATSFARFVQRLELYV